MKQCPDCRAPNPQSRTSCYACGQSLSRTPANTPSPGEPTYPCVNCAAAIPYRVTACPGCGRVITSPTPPAREATPLLPQAEWGDPAGGASLSTMAAAAGPLPGGWEVEVLPDGTVRLLRSLGNRLNRAAAPVGMALFLAIYFFFQGFLSMSLGGRVEPRTSVSAIFLIAFVGTFAAAYLLWFFAARDEVRAGAGFLEVRRELWGYRRRERFTMGVLRAETHETWGRDRRRVYRRLVAQNLGKRIVLDQVERGGLLGALSPDPVGPLGQYLSRVTGFALVDPENGRY